MTLRRLGSRRRQVRFGNERGAGVVGSLAEVVGIVLAAFVLALLIQQFVVKPFYIPSASMEPTLQEGDRVMVARFAYWFSDPEPGDIIVFHPPLDPGTDYIKRVVAVEGDRVAVVDGHLVVNGEARTEPYLREELMEKDFEEPAPVPDDHVFVMGDNRNHSGDSRVFGPVPEEDILGRAFLVYWPLSRFGVF